jgi:CHAD domain-containing protein
LRAYSPYLEKRVAKKFRKRLGDLMDKTNADRDNEVHVVWLEKQLARRKLPKVQRQGIELLLEQLTGKTDQAQDSTSVLKEYTKLSDKLSARLQKSRRGVKLDKSGRLLSFAQATATIVSFHAALLQGQLGEIHSVDDENPAHEARLTVKKLRYLIEPLRKDIKAATTAVRKLKDLQDLLGDLHDLHTLEERVCKVASAAATDWAELLLEKAKPGISLRELGQVSPELERCFALAGALKRVRSEQARLYGHLHRNWLDENAQAFFDLVAELCAELGGEPKQDTTSDAEPDVQEPAAPEEETETVPKPEALSEELEEVS